MKLWKRALIVVTVVAVISLASGYGISAMIGPGEMTLDKFVAISAGIESGCYNILPDPTEMELTLCNYFSLEFDRELGVTALLAERKYPGKAADLFGFFGETPEFQAIIKGNYQSVIPVVWFFVENDSIAFNTQNAMGQIVGELIRIGVDFFEDFTIDEELTFDLSALNPVQRAWRAVMNIYDHGNTFLSEFDLDEHGAAHWIMANRVVSVISGILLDGIETFESKFRMGEEITPEDILWAALDVAVITYGSLKLVMSLKGTKVANVFVKGFKAFKGTRFATYASKVASFGSKALKLKVVRWGVIGGVAYYGATHPQVLVDAIKLTANLLGQDLVWTITISIFVALLALFFIRYILPKLVVRFCKWGYGKGMNGYRQFREKRQA